MSNEQKPVRKVQPVGKVQPVKKTKPVKNAVPVKERKPPQRQAAKKQIAPPPAANGMIAGCARRVFAVLRSPYTVPVISVLSLIFIIMCFVTVLIVYTKLDSRITEEAEKNAAVLAAMEQQLLLRADEAEQSVRAAIDDSSEETRRSIRTLDMTYRALLDAQQRRTLEALYREDILAAERGEARAAFAAGRYVTANRLYGEIAEAHTNDLEARFYQYYSLFLINKMDRDQYLPIRNAMTLLEKQGYSRRELSETLSFIAEETGMNGEVTP